MTKSCPYSFPARGTLFLCALILSAATGFGQTKSQSGVPVTASNFRADVNASGSVNASDIGQVKASAGNALP